MANLSSMLTKGSNSLYLQQSISIDLLIHESKILFELLKSLLKS